MNISLPITMHDLKPHQIRMLKEMLKQAYDRGYRAGQNNPKCPRCGSGFAPDYLTSVCSTCDDPTYGVGGPSK